MNNCEICERPCNPNDVLCGVCRETIDCLAEIWPAKPPHSRTGATVATVEQGVSGQTAGAGIKNQDFHPPWFHVFAPSFIAERGKKLFLCLRSKLRLKTQPKPERRHARSR